MIARRHLILLLFFISALAGALFESRQLAVVGAADWCTYAGGGGYLSTKGAVICQQESLTVGETWVDKSRPSCGVTPHAINGVPGYATAGEKEICQRTAANNDYPKAPPSSYSFRQQSGSPETFLLGWSAKWPRFRITIAGSLSCPEQKITTYVCRQSGNKCGGSCVEREATETINKYSGGECVYQEPIGYLDDPGIPFTCGTNFFSSKKSLEKLNNSCQWETVKVLSNITSQTTISNPIFKDSVNL